jgi:hypothetical protein
MTLPSLLTAQGPEGGAGSLLMGLSPAHDEPRTSLFRPSQRCRAHVGLYPMLVADEKGR